MRSSSLRGLLGPLELEATPRLQANAEALAPMVAHGSISTPPVMPVMNSVMGQILSTSSQHSEVAPLKTTSCGRNCVNAVILMKALCGAEPEDNRGTMDLLSREIWQCRKGGAHTYNPQLVTRETLSGGNLLNLGMTIVTKHEGAWVKIDGSYGPLFCIHSCVAFRHDSYVNFTRNCLTAPENFAKQVQVSFMEHCLGAGLWASCYRRPGPGVV